jgi:hypothetical protein
MCHPISGSASGRFDNVSARIDQNKKMKMMSRTEGSRNRNADVLESDEVIKGSIETQSRNTEEAVYALAVPEASPNDQADVPPSQLFVVDIFHLKYCARHLYTVGQLAWKTLPDRK